MRQLTSLRYLFRVLPYFCLVLALSTIAAPKETTLEDGKFTLLHAMLVHTTWPQEDQIDQFVIGLYGRDRGLLEVLKRELPNVRVRGKPVVAAYYNSLSEARSAHILVVARASNSALTKIDRELRQSHTLIVTDRSADHRHVMINFTHPTEDLLSFEISSSNIEDAGLQLSKKILLFGGTKLDAASIYKETEAELVRARTLTTEQQQKLDVQQIQLGEQEDKIRQQSIQVAANESALAKLEQNLTQIQSTLAQSESQLKENEAALLEKETVLAEKEAYIESYSSRIEQNLARLATQQAEIKDQELLIAEKNSVLMKQGSTIENQQFILTAAAVVLLLVLTLIVIIFLSYRSKHRINLRLEGKTKELEVANEKLVLVTEAKSRFLSTMSHEIRTPMNGVIGMAELLEGTSLTDQQREYLSLIIKSADNLLGLINDILDFSKIEAGRLDLETIPFDLRDILGDTLQTLALRANEKELELTFHIPPDVPDRLLGDPIRLRQIVINLVGNAIKFTESGEVVVDLQVESTDQKAARLHFEVRDTGVGITEQQRGKIFEAFGQADSSTTRQYGGTGLGLAIAAQLAEMMGGKMAVTSVAGQGSAFSFTAEFGLPDGPATEPLHPAGLRGQRALVVDDNSTNRMILDEILVNWGMEACLVDSAYSALDAIERAEKIGQSFSLALLDVMMPGMDGFELAARIREKPAQKSMRILMLTSAGRSETEALRGELDISRILLKPTKHSDLLAAVTNALGVAKTEDEKPIAQKERLPEHPAKRVLLAEDNPINQMVAVDLLSSRGHNVEVVENGAEAVEALDKDAFDIVLMDINMPVMDGLAATQKIREAERTSGAHIPIVALTASATTEDRERCFAAGMDNFVTKPFRADELFRAVETASLDPGERRTQPAPTQEGKAGTAPEIETLAKNTEPAGDSAETAGGELPESPSSTSDADQPCLDWEGALKNLEGDQELLRELAQMFLDECPALMASISEAISKEDIEELRRTAHTLKGSALVIGGKAAGATALLLENMGRDAQFETAATAFQTLEEKIAELKLALQMRCDTEK